MKFFKSTVPDRDRVSFGQKVAYGLGGTLEGLAISIPQANIMPVFNVCLGINPALLGIILMLWRAWDACMDLLMGNISDNARTRWGRRRPFIVIGAILTGLSLPLVWWAPVGMSDWKVFGWLLVSGMVFYGCFSIWAMPYYSLQLEMTPDYNERTNITAYRAFSQQILLLAAGWILAFASMPFFRSQHSHNGGPDLANGMRYISLGLGLLTVLLGVLPGLFVKERYYRTDASKQPKERLWSGLKQTLSTRPFVYIVIIVFSKTFGYGLVGALGFYLNAYYACRGNIVLATTISGTTASVLFAPNLLAVPFCTWLANHFGKKVVLYATVISGMTGSLSMYVFLTPANPWLQMIPQLLIGPIGIGLALIVPSLQADVVDYDELLTGQRREGSFSAVFSWTYKASTALTAGLGGVLLVLTGFDISHGTHQAPHVLENIRMFSIWMPIGFLSLSLFAIGRYDLTQARMLDIRRQLEARRGVL